MDFVQLAALILGSGGIGAVAVKAIEQIGKQAEMKASRRRSEIDRADAAERKGRILTESLSIHRRIIIDAPCLGPADLPDYPDTKGLST